MGHESAVPSIVRLVKALQEARIRFQVVGMSSAVLQGVPLMTLDTDLWIDLPERQYMRVMNICAALGAQLNAKTVVTLEDGTLINFLYHVDGLASFGTEWRRAVSVELRGLKVKALPVERLIKSKELIRRPKDVAHLPYLYDFLAEKKLPRRAPRHTR